MPTLQFVPQLVPGVALGGVNCTCASAAMTVSHATGGRANPSASEVRALCRDKDGSPDTTAGTSLPQVADAVAKGWDVDLDVRMPMRFDAMWERLADPAYIAIAQVRYVVFHGNPVYALKRRNDINHAIVVRRREDMIEVFDPLADGRAPRIPRAPVPIPASLLRTAAARLNFRQGGEAPLGDGLIYVGFARAPAGQPAAQPAGVESPTTTSMTLPTRKRVRFATDAFFVYDVRGGRATREARRFSKKTGAPGEDPVRIEFNHRGRRLVKITGGGLAGRYVEPGRHGVELVEVRDGATHDPQPGEPASLLPADEPEELPEIPNDDIGEDIE